MMWIASRRIHALNMAGTILTIHSSILNAVLYDDLRDLSLRLQAHRGSARLIPDLGKLPEMPALVPLPSEDRSEISLVARSGPVIGPWLSLLIGQALLPCRLAVHGIEPLHIAESLTSRRRLRSTILQLPIGIGGSDLDRVSSVIVCILMMDGLHRSGSLRLPLPCGRVVLP